MKKNWTFLLKIHYRETRLYLNYIQMIDELCDADVKVRILTFDAWENCQRRVSNDEQK